MKHAAYCAQRRQLKSKRGALLAEFDCTEERAQADAIKHALDALAVKSENVKELEALGAAGTLEVSMASSWMRKMKPGDRFAFEIDETGETLKGKIVRFGAAATDWR